MTTDQKKRGTCRECRHEFTLTANGRIRSHKGWTKDADGADVRTDENCGGGSDLPVEAQSAAEEAAARIAAGPAAGPNSHREPLPTGQPTHHWGPNPGGPGSVLHRDAREDCTAPECREDTDPFRVAYDAACTRCNTDTHACPGCGDAVPHGVTICASCEVFYADTKPATPETSTAHVYDDGHGGVWEHPGGQGDCPLPECEPGPMAVGVAEDMAELKGRPVSGDVFAAPEPADEASDFLSGPADEAEEFLFGGPEQAGQESGKGPWFPSRYDGECSTCFFRYDAGDEIRADGEGGWECQENCGDDEGDPERPKPKPRPKAVRPKPPIVGGRYRLPHPETGVKWSGTRMTTFVKTLSDSFGLKEWELRCAIAGQALNPEMSVDVLALLDREDVGGSIKSNKRALNALAEKIKEAAGAKDAAGTGTKLHAWTEDLDAGLITVDDVPEAYRRHVEVYRDTLWAHGYRPVPHLMERTTAVAELGVIGTFDLVVQCPDGKYRTADKKSGSLDFGQDEMAAQLAGYVHGANRHGVASWSGEGSPNDWKAWRWERLADADGNPIRLEEDWAVIIHLPRDGSGCVLHRADLVKGWRWAQECRAVRDMQRECKKTLTPLPLPQQRDTGTAMPDRLADEPQESPLVGLLKQEIGDLHSPVERALEEAVADCGRKTDDGGSELDRSWQELEAAVQSRAAAPEPVRDWDAEFSGVASKEQAFRLYEEARSAGVQERWLNDLASIAQKALTRLAAPEPPTVDEMLTHWEGKVAAVRTREQAAALYPELRAALAQSAPGNFEMLVADMQRRLVS